MREFYGCEKCNTFVEVLRADKAPECCGKKMLRVAPNSVDAAVEKHVPVVKYTDTGVTVSVGSEPHPMEETHFIEWIEISYGSRIERKYLNANEKPEASFHVAAKDVQALISCNLHGLWISKS